MIVNAIMRSEFSLRNARIVTRDAVFEGSVQVQDGKIAAVSQGRSGIVGDDCQGDYILPGLVEIHTDNLEKHLMPRPKVNWPVLPAIVAHDAQVIAAGITTVLDAISVGDIEPESVRNSLLQASIRGLLAMRSSAALRSEHFLHLRLELAEPELKALFSPLLDDPSVKMVSLMDHTPGQRQWTDLEHYRTYVTGKRGWTQQKVDQMLDLLMQRQRQHVHQNRAEMLALCQRQRPELCLATHDDTTVEHVLQGKREGVSISEFPTTLAAAEAARQNGLAIVMGAPNRVRGGSHSGNVSAAELAQQGLLDILSSDYVPSSLLHAAFLLQDDGYSLARAIATVSSNPARAIGLEDRGEIAPGKQASLIRVRLIDGYPVVLAVWRCGEPVY